MKYWHTIVFILLIAQWCGSSESSSLNTSKPIPIPQKPSIAKTYSLYQNRRNQIYTTFPAKQGCDSSSCQNGMFEHHKNENGSFFTDETSAWSPKNIDNNGN